MQKLGRCSHSPSVQYRRCQDHVSANKMIFFLCTSIFAPTNSSHMLVSSQNRLCWLCMVVYTGNPSTWGSKFQASLGFLMCSRLGLGCLAKKVSDVLMFHPSSNGSCSVPHFWSCTSGSALYCNHMSPFGIPRRL